jgi:polygalacturonase
MINVRDHGAHPGLSSVQTAEIQSAIDTCAATGGGTVFLPAGFYETGMLTLRSNITLHLDNGAILKGSPRMEDYPEVAGGFTDAVGQKRNRCLIYANSATGTAITGQGMIDGNGGAFGHDQDGRPFMVRFINCSGVQVTGVTLKDSPGWVSHYLGCENVLIQGVTIRSHTNSNNDGIDVDSCRGVRIAGCDIDTGDDAICIKATRATPCENIVVTGCVIRSIWGALKLGTESAGDFRNIIFSDIVIRDTHGGGLKIISMDGCRIENIHVSNIIMDNVSGPIFVRLGGRLRKYFAGQPDRPVGIVKNVTIRNVTMRVWEEGCPLYDRLPRKAGIIVTGIPGHCIEDLTFENIDATFPGGGTAEESVHHDVPEQEKEYPEFPCFHPLPAWGFYLRHARNVRFRDVRMRTEKADMRAAFFSEDVEHLRLNEVEINGNPAGDSTVVNRPVQSI